MNNISFKLKELKGKTIVQIETMNAEFGRTYDRYLCFTCDDGTRVMLHGGEPWNPNPKLEDMQKINFFTPKEIGKKLEQIETEKRQRELEKIREKKNQLERLKKELGEI